MSNFLISAGIMLIALVWWIKLRQWQIKKDREKFGLFYKQYVPKEHWPEWMKGEDREL